MRLSRSWWVDCRRGILSPSPRLPSLKHFCANSRVAFNRSRVSEPVLTAALARQVFSVLLS